MHQGREDLVNDAVLIDAAINMEIENFHLLSHNEFGEIYSLLDQTGSYVDPLEFKEFEENHNYVIYEGKHYISVKCIDKDTLEIQDSTGDCVKRNPTKVYQEKDNCRDEIYSIFQKIFGTKLPNIVKDSKDQVGVLGDYLENAKGEDFRSYISGQYHNTAVTIIKKEEKEKTLNKKDIKEFLEEKEQKNILQHEAFKGKKITVKTPILKNQSELEEKKITVTTPIDQRELETRLIDQRELETRLIEYFKEEDSITSYPGLLTEPLTITPGKGTLKIKHINKQAKNECAFYALSHLAGEENLESAKKIIEELEQKPAEQKDEKKKPVEQNTMPEEKKDTTNQSSLIARLLEFMEPIGSHNLGMHDTMFGKGREIKIFPNETYKYDYKHCSSIRYRLKHPLTYGKSGQWLNISDKSQITVTNPSGNDKNKFLNHIAYLSNETGTNHISLNFEIDAKDIKELQDKIANGRSVKITYLDKKNQEETTKIKGAKKDNHNRLTHVNINTSQNNGHGRGK